MNKRIRAVAAVLAMAAPVLATSGPTEAAAPAITLSSSSVQVGGTLTASADGCLSDEAANGPTYSYRRADLVLITITPAGERLASGGGDADSTLTVPGWVNPADPAIVTGRCVQTSYDTQTGTRTQSVAFTYADVPVDITPGTDARTPALALDRSTAAGGQVISTTGTGCGGADYASVVLLRGGDLSGRTPIEYVTASDDGDGAQDGPVPATVSGQLALNGQSSDYDGGGYGTTGGPLAEGDYLALFVCESYSDTSSNSVLSEPQLVHVVGTTPSGSLMARVTDAGQVEVSGEGCTGGQTVAVHVDGYRYGSPFLSQLNARVAALKVGNRVNALASADDSQYSTFAYDETITPAADGTWTYSFDAPTDSFELSATADCGVATADGFRYSPRYLREDHTAEIDLSRISPTSSPVGGAVTAHGYGYCGVDPNNNGVLAGMDPAATGDHVLTIQLVDRTGAVLSESPAQLSERYRFITGTVTAPSTPGDYFLVGTCDGERGYPMPYEVFTPTTLAATGPAAPEAATGWPRSGAPETYNGRIGPITLPAMDMGGDMTMGGGVAHAGSAMAPSNGAVSATTMVGAPIPPGGLGPSGLFIDVPRPTGDFAITKMSIGLVDAQGNEVSAEAAHLHHFVIGNSSRVNPACPDGTFGIPGQITAAAGAERTVLDTGDGPYGIVVKSSDVWKGVYMLMSRAHVDQQVYLSYDMEYRRDVQNVRPLTPYFGSATGCSSFTWDIDGSATPDVQSHYVSIAKDGLLLGTGAHFHNGGSYADLSDDRGRRLCRSEMNLKNEVIGMGDMHGGMDDGYPPEFYDDDQVIAGITNCQLHEKVKAGERLRFDTAYANDRARSGVMGIYTFYVWEGGGPKAPGVLGPDRNLTNPTRSGLRPATGARPVTGRPNYAG